MGGRRCDLGERGRTGRLECCMVEELRNEAPSVLAGDDIEAARRLAEDYGRVRAELGEVIVGQDDVLEQLLIALFANGHCILEGVPGLAKTLMISTLARSLSLSFNRIQFTPDLMPSDITGTEVIQEDKVTGTRAFKFLPGRSNHVTPEAPDVNRSALRWLRRRSGKPFFLFLNYMDTHVPYNTKPVPAADTRGNQRL